ncbi:uncharacterized protein BDZ99DRAFT_481860 [Mytilinidion resinicola]|uniref:Zn(2)-C6 fungal-type domain-containing protein n=1 Tax=Mytilinidion resinicola TaxID=574789 RepID=A0A6A6Y5T6_9PEZI|nr:uncharacterized protein BDZ99DRAFT_481860 [Mytilinidion resinicola]KAF2803888.1 hypothetical protein BDZ99DRAFT_481860 [Mytilinidion resinicola]
MDGNPSVSEQTPSVMPDHDASPLATTDTPAFMTNVNKRQNEALNRDLTAMEGWGLGQENKVEFAEKRVGELEVGLEKMEVSRDEEKASKEALELEKKSLVEQISAGETQMNGLKLEIEGIRGLHDEEKNTIHEHHDAEIRFLLNTFHKQLGYLQEQVGSGTEKRNHQPDGNGTMSLDENAIMNFKAEHWKQIKEIFALLDTGKSERVRQYEKTCRLEKDLGKVTLDTTTLRIEKSILENNLGLEKELRDVKRVKEKLEAEFSNQDEPWIKKEVDHWPPEKFRLPEDPPTHSSDTKRAKLNISTRYRGIQPSSRDLSAPQSLQLLGYVLASSENSGSGSLPMMKIPVSTDSIQCGRCQETNPTKGWLTGWSCFLEIEFESNTKGQETTSCYCGHSVTYTMSLESCLADSEPPKLSPSFDPMLSKQRISDRDDSSVYPGAVLYDLRTRQATIEYSSHSSRVKIRDFETEVGQWVARSLREWFSIPRPQFWAEYRKPKRRRMCLYCQTHKHDCFPLNPRRREACVICSRRGVPCLVINGGVFFLWLTLLPLADDYRKGLLWKSLISWKDPETVKRVEREKELRQSHQPAPSSNIFSPNPQLPSSDPDVNMPG